MVFFILDLYILTGIGCLLGNDISVGHDVGLSNRATETAYQGSMGLARYAAIMQRNP